MWAPTLNPDGLSQGDILKAVPTGATKCPMVFLPKEGYEAKGQPPRILYTKYDQLQEYPNEPGMGNFISKGRISYALVVTHDCDLDDVDDSERIMVAPVFPIARVTSSEVDRVRIMSGARATYVPLPGLPELGDSYAELRSMCPLDRSLLTPESRLCSMTEDAVWTFRAQLVDYFTRLKQKHVIAAMQAQIFEEKSAKLEPPDGRAQGAEG